MSRAADGRGRWWKILKGMLKNLDGFSKSFHLLSQMGLDHSFYSGKIIWSINSDEMWQEQKDLNLTCLHQSFKCVWSDNGPFLNHLKLYINQATEILKSHFSNMGWNTIFPKMNCFFLCNASYVVKLYESQ